MNTADPNKLADYIIDVAKLCASYGVLGLRVPFKNDGLQCCYSIRMKGECVFLIKVLFLNEF